MVILQRQQMPRQSITQWRGQVPPSLLHSQALKEIKNPALLDITQGISSFAFMWGLWVNFAERPKTFLIISQGLQVGSTMVSSNKIKSEDLSTLRDLFWSDSAEKDK